MNKDYLLLAIVTLMSLGANLPTQIIGLSGVDRKILVGGLLLVVTVSLVRYSKLALVLAIGILAIGANLPHEIAGALNIEPRILMLALGAIVLFSLANRLLKLPTGLEKQRGSGSDEGSQALFRAVAKGRIEIVRRILDAGTNVNARSRQGYTALMIAASHGHDDILRLLLDSDADLTVVDAEGRNALLIARESGRAGCIALLRQASRAEHELARNAVQTT